MAVAMCTWDLEMALGFFKGHLLTSWHNVMTIAYMCPADGALMGISTISVRIGSRFSHNK